MTDARPVQPAPHALTTPAELRSAGLAADTDPATLAEVARHFRIRITPAMQDALSAAESETAPNPVAAQFVPSAAELVKELRDRVGRRPPLRLPHAANLVSAVGNGVVRTG